MARSRGDAEFLHDLETFCRLCEALDQEGGAASFGRLSERLEVPASTLQSCRSRLERDLGAPLLQSLPRSGSNTLTAEGRTFCETGSRILRQLRDLQQRPFARSTTVRFAASQTLLVHLLPAVIQRFLFRQRQEGREVSIRIDDAYEPEETVARIKAGDLDFAVVWDMDDREGLVTRNGLVYYKFANPFDLVVICGLHHPFAARLESAPPQPVRLEELARDVLLCLPAPHQPLADRLPPPVEGGERVLLQHFSKIIEFLRAGYKGVAVVPGLYRELDYYRKTGDLVHLPLAPLSTSDEGGEGTPRAHQLGVAAVFRGQLQNRPEEGRTSSLDDYLWPTKSSPSGDLLRQVEAYFRDNLPLRRGWDVNVETVGVARAFRRLRDFSRGWYVWCEGVGFERPVWNVTDVAFSDEVDPRRGTGKQGTMTFGHPAEEYDVEADLFGKSVLTLKGSSRFGHGHFVAHLNMSIVEADGRALAGTWAGQDGRKQPLAGPFILTNGEVDARTVVQLNRAAMLRVLVNVNLQGPEQRTPQTQQ